MTPANIRLAIILSLVPWLFAAYFKARPWLHLLQLEGYKGRSYLGCLKRHHAKIFAPRVLLELGVLPVLGAGILYSPLPESRAMGLLIAFWLLLQALQILWPPRTGVKKELVFTARLLRLVAAFKVVIGFEALLCLWLLFPPLGAAPDWLGAELGAAVWLFIFLQLGSALAPLNVWLAGELILPVEERIKQGYLRQAREIVRGCPQLEVIAVTGSYGKTSTKYILNSIMTGTPHPTLMTPESYNTPMGICKVIRGQLRPFHRFFIVEMGARQRGDIAELCRLTPPRMGILTAIGPQHLESFGSQEAIAATKGELLQALPQDGVAVINWDNQYCRQLAQDLRCRCLGYGLGAGPGKQMWAEDVSSDPAGTRFMLCSADGEQLQLRTRLLGEHNVYNILAAACAARYLGVSLDNIARAVARLQPVPHRLQLLRAEGGVSIIDDAFNSNPAGARAALEVLRGFSSGKKILITPGMVELGAREFEQNRKFGQMAAGVCDFVILVGPKRTTPIAQGLREAGFAGENIRVVKDLQAARRVMRSLVSRGDVVLFENDLPDNYSES